MSRRALWRLAGLGLAVAVTLALLLQLGRDWTTLAGAAQALRLDARPLAAAWLLQSAGWLLVVDTWRRILVRMDPEGAAGLAFARHLRAHTLSGLANVLPGSVWLPVTRLAGYRETGLQPVAVGAAMALEWLLLGIAGLLLYALAAPFSQLPRAVSALALAVAGGTAALALHPAVFARLLGLVSGRLGLAGPPPRPRLADLLPWLARELAVLVLAGLGLYLLMRALGPVASLPTALGVTGLTLALANLLAWLPASALLKDASMVALLTPLYGAVAPALLVVVAWRLWLTLVQLSWAGLASWAARLPPMDRSPA